MLLWPLPLGYMPQSGDHPVHLARAWQFVSELLARGRLSGWSELWFAGWPAGEDYPPGANLWVAAVYLVTFGRLGWETSYAIAFLGAFAFTAVALYELGRTQLGAVAGWCAALLFLVDRGVYREGGWVYFVWWGVWPQMLSMAFLLLAFSRLPGALASGRPRELAQAALALGASLITHPLALVGAAIGLPLAVLVRPKVHDLPVPRWRAAAGRALLVGLLSGALAAWWLLPFVAKREWMASYGAPWKSLAQLGADVVHGRLFGAFPPWVLGLGALGAAYALVRRHRGAAFITLLTVGILALSSAPTWPPALRAWLPSLANVQFQRLSVLAKVGCWLLAGLVLQELWAWGLRRSSHWPRRGRQAVAVVAVGLTLIPVGGALARHAGTPRAATFAPVLTRRDLPGWRDYRRFLRWSRGLRRAGEGASRPFFRIAYLGLRSDQSFGAAPVYNHLPAYKVGFLPATNFAHKPEAADAELLRVLGVAYVVNEGELARPWPTLRLERHFGPIFVYRFTAYDPRRYTLVGAGRVRVERFEPDHVRLRLQGGDPSTRLVLHRSNYANWVATNNGQPLRIDTATLARHRMFIGLAPRDGVVELVYRRLPVDVIGPALTLLACLATALMLRHRKSTSQVPTWPPPGLLSKFCAGGVAVLPRRLTGRANSRRSRPAPGAAEVSS